ncbi:MAG: hypothetical protein FJ206_03155 [Gemmatimonadetes bacterium]|nr:hypothetical protein [Gemmatimonadota bacterium]
MKQSVAFAAIIAALSGCQSGSLTSPSADQAANDVSLASGGGGTAATVRVRCEVRSNRSKISIDGNNLTPLGGTFSARAISGANTASAPAKQAIGDEAEFDFDSAPNDIAAGAVAIAPGFITAGKVTGEIRNGAGAVVASATATCQTR